MGVCFSQNPKGSKSTSTEHGSVEKMKEISTSSLNCHLSLTEEEGKHLLVFKEMVWTLRRNLSLAIVASKIWLKEFEGSYY